MDVTKRNKDQLNTFPDRPHAKFKLNLTFIMTACWASPMLDCNAWSSCSFCTSTHTGTSFYALCIHVFLNSSRRQRVSAGLS